MNPEDIVEISTFEETHWWYRERQWLLRKFLRMHHVNGRALDIGASAGNYSVTLQEMGLNVIAIENEPAGVAICQSRGLQAMKGNAESLEVTSGSQDLVIMMDVLEHVKNDLMAISEVSRVLKVGGFLFLTIPVGMDLWSEFDVQARHFRRYEYTAIEEILNLNNIEILNHKYWNVILRPILILQRRYFKENGVSLPSKPVNFILATIIKMERILPVGKLRGVSMIVVGQKTY
jgi:2-polyprenyl-3-methyl-5-hydroxy-6-metoxy-1,4-benzoquinol methylase